MRQTPTVKHAVVVFRRDALSLDFKCQYSLHGKNDFAAIFKNLVRYRYENNFIGSSKYNKIM